MAVGFEVAVKVEVAIKFKAPSRFNTEYESEYDLEPNARSTLRETCSNNIYLARARYVKRQASREKKRENVQRFIQFCQALHREFGTV